MFCKLISGTDILDRCRNRKILNLICFLEIHMVIPATK